MAKRLLDKACIVTGASRGIGRAIALKLAEEGARVGGVGRDLARLKTLEKASERIRAFAGDVSDEAAVRDVVGEVVRWTGRLDVLVNNAGIGAFAPVEEMSYREFLRVLEVNAGGTFLFSREVLRHMYARGDGDIINISSVVGEKGYARQTAYGASKHAVMGFTKALAVEAQPRGVRVRSVCPGGVDTDLIRRARPDLDRSELMRPEDIAELVVFLLTFSSSAVVDNVNVRRRGNLPWF